MNHILLVKYIFISAHIAIIKELYEVEHGYFTFTSRRSC